MSAADAETFTLYAIRGNPIHFLSLNALNEYHVERMTERVQVKVAHDEHHAKMLDIRQRVPDHKDWYYPTKEDVDSTVDDNGTFAFVFDELTRPLAPKSNIKHFVTERVAGTTPVPWFGAELKVLHINPESQGVLARTLSDLGKADYTDSQLWDWCINTRNHLVRLILRENAEVQKPAAAAVVVADSKVDQAPAVTSKKRGRPAVKKAETAADDAKAPPKKADARGRREMHPSGGAVPRKSSKYRYAKGAKSDGSARRRSKKRVKT